MPQSVPDAELVRRFKEGDRSAYAEIVRRYQDRVFTLCLRWMGDRGVAEDVQPVTASSEAAARAPAARAVLRYMWCDLL